jgi:tRNA nucleotidyltransferase (CCA-adding enzyme)
MAARFCMSVDSALPDICASLDLSELPGERLHEEFRKLLLKGREPSRGLLFLRSASLLEYFPELEALIDVPQDPTWHPEGDVWTHTLMSLDRAAELRTLEETENEAMMFSVLCHDFGKPDTTSEVDGRIRSIAHDQAGTGPTNAFMDRLCTSSELRERTVALVEHHLAPVQLVEQAATPKAYRRLARKLGRAGVSLRLLERVARADHLGRTTQEAKANRFPAGDAFLERADALDVGRVGPKDVVLGRHLIARGREPAPQFAAILERCREIQDETGLTEPDAILERALRDFP